LVGIVDFQVGIIGTNGVGAIGNGILGIIGAGILKLLLLKYQQKLLPLE
jgi:hypothetical protein